MNYLYQLTSAVRRLLTNTPALITKIGVFMILTLILGSVFSESFNLAKEEEITVAYVLEDNDTIAGSIIYDLTENEEIGEYISFLQEKDFASAEKNLAEEKYDAVLLIQDGFSKKIMEGDAAMITVYMTSYATTKASVIKSCVQGFLNQVNVYLLQLNTDGSDAMDAYVSMDYPLEGEHPDSMTYYAIAMLLMMLFYGADYGNSGAAEDYFGAVGDRLSIAPVNRFGMFAAKMLGTAIVNFLLACMIILFTGVAFKTNWGNNYPILLLIIFEFSLLSTVFGAFLCLILGNEQRASAAIQIFALGFTIVSGGFYAGDFNMAKYFSFNYYAKTAISNLIYNSGNLSTTWENMGILLGGLMVLSAACIAASKRRKAGNL